MKLTNELGLPQPIVNAVNNDEYDKGDCDFSTTGLIAPVRIQALKAKYGEHLVEDASDRIFSLMGQAMHTVLERAAEPVVQKVARSIVKTINEIGFDSWTDDEITKWFKDIREALKEAGLDGSKERYRVVEKRYYADFDMNGALMKPGDRVEYAVRVGGKFDLMDYLIDTETNTLSDYKFTSHYAVNEGVKPEWEQQLNVNAYILHRNGFKIDKLQLVAIFRDWSKMRAEQKRDYPPRQVEILPVGLWPNTYTVHFIRERIKAHVEGAQNPPLCTPEERWRKPDRWALMKKGTKKAIKLFDSQEQALIAANYSGQHPQYYVEPRPSTDKRCRFYCPVVAYCDYGRQVLAGEIE